MANSQSPSIDINEIDLTGIVPSVDTTQGAFAGIFSWGPVGKRILIDSEATLVSSFGTPSSTLNPETWFTAANFLSYANRLFITRAANTTSTNTSISALNAFANVGTVSNVLSVVVKNSDDYYTKNGTFDVNALYLAKYPGTPGNSLRISICDSANAYSSNLYMTGQASSANVDVNVNFSIAIGANTGTFVATPGLVGSANDVVNYATGLFANLALGDYISVGNSTIGTQYLQLAAITNVVSNSTTSQFTVKFQEPYRLATAFSTANTNPVITRKWEFFNRVDKAPGVSPWVKQYGNTALQLANTSAQQDEMHVVVVDNNGYFSGLPGSILETFIGVSRAIDSETSGGQSNYYVNAINNGSRYVWFAADRAGAPSNTSVNVVTSTNNGVLNLNFSGGSDGYTEATVPLQTIATAYDTFASSEDVDIALVLQGKPIGGTTVVRGQTVSNFQLANYIIQNICQQRKDCIAFISPDDGLVTSNVGNEAVSIANWRGALGSSSYGVMDSGYKYQYDRYNNVYRYVPLNGDIAGLCVRTDSTNDAWWSPAGFNRGQINNVIRLRFNPRKSDRDILFSAGVNPVVTFPGDGTILFGDKTLLDEASAFNAIGVRRLFIVLEKAISKMARNYLFEFNDVFTQAQFRNQVNPYLRDIQARRGITQFDVVCDSRNNTPFVINSNKFVGSIFVSPNRSIRNITLNFVAVGTGVQFSTVESQIA